ncbi:MAG TPA: methyl-accepting chemotaxis protein [Cyanobacteria bacterium UBA8553]|nr:methyl-accepting chemotaxis protein [Cyanobacteria bacterium UBA8553]
MRFDSVTQIPPKPVSENTNNGQGSSSQANSGEGLTYGSNYSSVGLMFSQEETGIKTSNSGAMKPQFKTYGASVPQEKTSWWRSASLRTKATVVALAIGTVPVVLVGLTAYFVASQSIEEQIIKTEKTIAVDLEDKLNIFVKQLYGDVVSLSKLPAFSNSKVREIITDQERNELLEQYLKDSQIYSSIVIYDLKGKVIAQSQGEVPSDLLNLDYTQAVLKTDRPVIVDPRPSLVTGELSFFTAAPVKDKDTQQTIAIIRTRVPMGLINNVFGIDASRGGNFYLTDSQRQVTASSKKEVIQKKLSEVFPKLASQIEQNKSGQRAIAINNQEQELFTYVPNAALAKAYNLNWGLLLTLPKSTAFAPQRQFLLAILYGTIIVALIVAMSATVIANRATRPILAATRAVEKLGQGELDTRLEVEGEDELAYLGANINNMAGQIEKLLQEQVLAAEERQRTDEQLELKEALQQRALELLMEVDPISKGDLTIRAKVTADEIGTIADSYNATVANLRKVVVKVQAAATQVAETTSTNEASVQALSAEALQQAEEIAQALERAKDMAQSVRLVAANAEQALVAVQQAQETVEEGDVAMNRTVNGILAIRETVAETAKKVKHLGESSQKISTVVNLIGSFAAQTNLLALNASIEAARAGEEGRGFAVVADEVRSLARQSAEATAEIEKLVAAIQTETNEVVTAMESGTEQVVTGTRLVDETRQSLNRITVASSKISELVEAIAKATVIQTQASEEVTQTMTNVATIANKTSQEATIVSSSFEQLLKVAQALQEDIGQFKVS